MSGATCMRATYIDRIATSEAPMDDETRIRDRATRLFALAIQARERGDASADDIIKLANEALSHAEEIQRRVVTQQQQPRKMK
jgi:hypothetical protein